MLTFTGLVFSVTILVLQLASSQFSPRVLRTFLKDRPSKWALGIFVGTFVYALLGLRSVRNARPPHPAYVPSFTIWFAVVLSVACVFAFIGYIHHIAQSIRAVVVISRIHKETAASLRSLYPESIGGDTDETDHSLPLEEPSLIVLHRGRPGVLESVDEDRLLHCAQRAKVVVGLIPKPGDFVADGGALVQVWGDSSGLNVASLLSAVNTGIERSIHQDAGFGFRQLVDLAERALSPGVNDPTTAVQALDALHDLLRRLIRRRFPSPRRTDSEGVLRLFLPRPDWQSYLRLALDEIRHSGSSSIQITRRLRFLIEDLLEAAPAFRRQELERQMHLLQRATDRAFPHEEERMVASEPSAQGHGPGVHD
jgi:uncharacterized membrane protein